jgi:hypothetical protein
VVNDRRKPGSKTKSSHHEPPPLQVGPPPERRKKPDRGGRPTRETEIGHYLGNWDRNDPRVQLYRDSGDLT